MANLYEIQKGAAVKQAFGKLMDYSHPANEMEGEEDPQE